MLNALSSKNSTVKVYHFLFKIAFRKSLNNWRQFYGELIEEVLFKSSSIPFTWLWYCNKQFFRWRYENKFLKNWENIVVKTYYTVRVKGKRGWNFCFVSRVNPYITNNGISVTKGVKQYILLLNTCQKRMFSLFWKFAPLMSAIKNNGISVTKGLKQ